MSNSLRRKAIVHYSQLCDDDRWLGNHSAKDKKMSVMANELGKLKASGGGNSNPSDGPKSNDGKSTRWAIDE